MSGFRKCGIHPISLEELFKRLFLKTTTDPEGLIKDAFLKFLEEKRRQ